MKRILIILVFLLISCVPANSTPRSLTVDEKESIRQTKVADECARYPERCQDDEPWLYDSSCEPPVGQKIDWQPPSHCYKNRPTGEYVSETGESCPLGCTEHKLGCDIKGNISINADEKIYHVQGGEFYDKTIIKPEYGERWFCTEAEAEANGWRKSYK